MVMCIDVEIWGVVYMKTDGGVGGDVRRIGIWTALKKALLKNK